jgi:hypothetical protein
MAVGYDSSTHEEQWAHMAQKKVDEWKMDVRDDVSDEPILTKKTG